MVIAPFLRGSRERSAQMRFASGLQELGHTDLAALVWYTLLQEDLSQLHVRRPLVSCLRELGLDDFLVTPGLPEPSFDTFDRKARGRDVRLSPEAWRTVLVRYQEQCLRLMASGREEAAFRIAREALSLAESQFGGIEAALAHNLIGVILDRGGRLREAEAHWRRALAILQGLVLPDHKELVVILNNLAANLVNQQRYPEARKLLRQALAVVRDKNTHVAILISASRIQLRLGDIAEAHALTQEATVLSTDPDKIDQQSSFELETLQADVAFARGQTAVAIEHLEALLKRQVAVLGTDSREAAITLNNLSRLYEELEQPKRAEELLEESLAMRRRILGEEHPDTATVYNNLGLLHARQGRLASARRSLSSALTIRQAKLPVEHPYQAVTLQNLAEVEEALGHHEQAFEHLRQAFICDSALLSRMASGRTDSERSMLIGEASYRSSALVMLVMRYLADRPAAVRTAVACIVARKGFLDGDADKEAVARHEPVYRSYVTRLTSLVLGGPRNLSTLEYAEEVENLRQRLRAIEADRGLGEVHIPDAESVLDKLSARLGDRLLLEFIRLEPPAGPAHKESVAHYVVALISADRVHLVDLGPATKIDKLISRFRIEIIDAGTWIGRNEHAAEARLSLISRAIYQLLLSPLNELLHGVQRIVLAPDSYLHLLPFGALVNHQGRYVIEDFEIAYLGAAHELLREARPPAGGDICLFADPDFAVAPTHPIKEPQRAPHTRLSHQLATTRWRPLPGTRREADAICEAWSDENVRVFIDDQATERNLKELSSPRILHIATHGYFLDDNSLLALPNGEDSPYELNVPAMLRSGMVLAGANTIAERPVSGETDKGLISALEISTLDLRATELVVLSACETGVGEPLRGQGVLGLRRAFQQAGAQQLVCTLWKVPDEPSADLLRRFYGYLCRGLEPARALHIASLESLLARRNAGHASHPLFWAAFIAVGSPRTLSVHRSS